MHELQHLLAAIAQDGEVGPHGADFEDGYRAAVVCDAIVRSAGTVRANRCAIRWACDPRVTRRAGV